MQQTPHLILLVGEDSPMITLGNLIEKAGYRIGRADGPGDAARLMAQDRPALVVRAAGPSGSSLSFVAKGATRLDVPVLDIVEDGADPGLLVDRHGEADDWVYRSRVEIELPARVGRLIRRGERRVADFGDHPTNPIDSKFLGLVVHDLRTPLNVVSLSLSMIDQVVPRNDPDLLDDLKFVKENFKQIEHMLVQLSDYCRLYEGEAPLTATEFSPARMIGDLVEDRAMKAVANSTPLRLRIEESCPEEASLDLKRAHLAIQYAVSNALASSQDVPVEITMRGAPGRVITEIRIDRPPPSTVKSMTLRPSDVERLCGVAAERRGLDLAIAARVSQMFGGTARLDVVVDRDTTIVLDWPTRLPTA